MNEQQAERAIAALENIAIGLGLLLKAISEMDGQEGSEPSPQGIAIRTMDDPPLEAA